MAFNDVENCNTAMLVIVNINLTEVRNKHSQVVDEDKLVNLLFLHLTEERF